MPPSFIPTEVWDNFITALRYVYIAMPVWLPAVFLAVLFNSWVYYRRTKFWQKEGSVLLEIKLPREITKSPLAMEVVLGSFFQTSGESTWLDRIWKGQTRSWFSLEIASIEGKIRFFIWTKPKHRIDIESQIYSQYPGVEIYEAEDDRKAEILKNKNLNQLYKEIMSKVKTGSFILLLFGSYAKKTQTKTSDIDLLFISNEHNFENKISDILSLLPLKTHALTFTEEEFVRMKDSKKSNVIHEAIESNIILYGTEAYYRLKNA